MKISLIKKTQHVTLFLMVLLLCSSFVDNKNSASNPNSFIVYPGSTLDFSTSKAFDIWRLHAEQLLPVEWGGDTVVSVLWEDTPVLRGLPKLSKDKKQITLETLPKQEGNALIALSIDTTIIWSWHIWVTKYNPDILKSDTPSIGENIVQNGSIYKYNNTAGGNTDYVFMDRYLGETQDAVALLYQWGRKDPFPLSDSLFRKNKKQLVISTINVTEDSVRNLTQSITFPSNFITSRNLLGDWYNYSAANASSMWNDRWGKNGVKSPFDPCPEGWQVPHFMGGKSPWFHKNLRRSPKEYGVSKNVFKNRAWLFDTNNNYQLGTYKMTGGRSASSGEYSNEDNTYVWSATPNGTNAFNYYLLFWDINPAASNERGNALAVRCVKQR